MTTSSVFRGGDTVAATRLSILVGWLTCRQAGTQVLLFNVPLAICVLDVKPQDIIRDLMCVEPGIHGCDICLVFVVPAALVVSDREHLRKRGGTWWETTGTSKDRR